MEAVTLTPKHDQREATYLTELGELGEGRAFNRYPELAVRFIHDLLLRASIERLDVSILSGSLREEFRDRYFAQVCSVTFAGCLERLVAAGSSVRILMWTKLRKGIISPAIRDILDRRHASLKVCASGTEAFASSLNHFIIAHSQSLERCLVRIEEPHRVRSLDEPIDSETSQLPAVVLLGGPAKRVGAMLLDTFDALWNAALAANREYSQGGISGVEV